MDTTTESAHLRLANVTKTYPNGAEVLRDITLDIPPRAFVSIIGSSGCGKSTLLKLISGLSPLTSGSISIAGQTPEQAQRGTSFVFQDPTLLPWLTVTRNIVLGLELSGAPKNLIAEKAASLLHLVRLSHVADQYPRQLSGGMKMRVSIARALAGNPELLLLDEPFAALDELSRNRLNEELLRLRETGKWSGIFVTHSVPEAVFLSSRIIVLAPHPGRVSADFTVPLPYPRTGPLRDSPEFIQVVSHVSSLLRHATPEDPSETI